MKRSVKIICTLFLLSLVTLLGACTSKTESKQPDKSLYEHGLEVIALMQEMAGNEEYTAALFPSPEFNDILSETAQGDFSKPKAVYQIKISESEFFKLSELNIDTFSKPLQEFLKARTNSAVFSQINALGNENMLAAASVCTASKTFVSNELTKTMIYLYVYENAVPVAVTFAKGENNAVSASGLFVLYDEFHADSESDIEGYLSQFHAQVEEIEI